MRNCEDIAESLGVWLDGELSLADAEVIRLHLESCAQCDGKRRQLEKLNSSLKSLLGSNLPQLALEPFWRGVQERIAEKRTWRQEVTEWIRFYLGWTGSGLGCSRRHRYYTRCPFGRFIAETCDAPKQLCGRRID